MTTGNKAIETSKREELMKFRAERYESLELENILVQNGEVNYYRLCKRFKSEILFEALIIDLDQPIGTPQGIKEEYIIHVKEYMNSMLNELEKVNNYSDSVYFMTLSLTYILYSTYPGGNNAIKGDWYLTNDELVNLIIKALRKHRCKRQVCEETITNISKFMYDLLTNPYDLDSGNKIQVLENCEDTWVTNLAKAYYYIEGLYDDVTRNRILNYIPFKEFKTPDSYYMNIYQLLESIPYSLSKYLWEFSEQLSDNQAAVGFWDYGDGTNKKFIDSEIDAHIIPLLNPFGYINSYNHESYKFFKSFKGHANYHNMVINRIHNKYKLNIEIGKDAFDKKILELDSIFGPKVIEFINNIENSDPNTKTELPYRVRSYFYSAEALFILIESIKQEDDLELSFMITNYLKGMEVLLVDSIKYILNFKKIKLKFYDKIEKYTCGNLIYYITYNKQYLTNNPKEWGYIEEGLQGFAGDFYSNWISKIRNGKMHKTPILRNYPEDDAPQGVRLSTYLHLIELLKKLDI